MKYANYNKTTGLILGWFDDEIHKIIPTPSIKATDSVWQEAININANCYEDGKFLVKDFRTAEEIAQQALDKKITEAKQFLGKTDKKVLPYYEFESGDNTLEWYIEERSKSRKFIRDNQ